MAGQCAFCGKKLGLFNDSLVCGNISQPVCQDCRKKYQDAPQALRCRDLVEKGSPVEPELVRAFLEREQKELDEINAEQERLGKLMSCCGQPMTPVSVSEFQLGCQGFFTGDWPNIIAGAMELAVFQCERCGQVKFMNPKFIDPRAIKQNLRGG